MSFNRSENNNDDFGEFFDAATSTSEVTMSTSVGVALKHIQPSYVSQQSALTDADSTEVSGFGDFVDAYSGLEDTTYNDILTKPTDGILNSNGSALDNDPFASLVPETIQQPISPLFVSFPTTSTTTTPPEPTINIQTVKVSESSNEFGDFVEVLNPLASSSSVGAAFGDVSSPTALELGEIPEYNGYSSQLPNMASFIATNIIDQTQSDDPFAALGPVNDTPIPSIASYDSNEQDIIMHKSTNVTSHINTTNSNPYESSAMVGTGVHDPSALVNNHNDVVNNDVQPKDMSDIKAAVTDVSNLFNTVVQTKTEDDDFGDFVAPTKSISPLDLSTVYAGGLTGNGVQNMSDIKVVTDVSTSFDAAAQITTEDDDFGDFVAPTTSTSPLALSTFSGGLNSDGAPDIFTNSDTIQQQVYNGISADDSKSYNTMATIDATITNPYSMSMYGVGDVVGATTMHTAKETFVSNTVVLEDLADPFANIATETNQAVDLPSYLQPSMVPTPGEPIHVVDVSESSNDFGDFVEVSKTDTTSSDHIDITTTTSFGDVQTNTALEIGMNSGILQSTNGSLEISHYTPAPTPQAMEASQLDDPFAALGATSNAPIASTFQHDFMIPNSSDVVNPENVYPYETSAPVGFGIYDPLEVDMINNHEPIYENINFGAQQVESFKTDTMETSGAIKPFNTAQISTEDDNDEFGDFVAPHATTNPLNLEIANSGDANGSDVHDISVKDNSINQQEYQFVVSVSDQINYTGTTKKDAGDVLFTTAVSHDTEFEGANDNVTEAGDEVVNSNIFGSNDYKDPFASIVTEASQSFDLPSYMEPMIEIQETTVPTGINVTDTFGDFEAKPLTTTSIVDDLKYSFPGKGANDDSGEKESALPTEIEGNNSSSFESAASAINAADVFMYGGIKLETATMEPSNAGIVNNRSDVDDDFGDFGASPASQISPELDPAEIPLPSLADNFDFGGLDSTPEIASKADHRLAAQMSIGANVISTDVDNFVSSGTSETVDAHFGQAPPVQGDFAKIEQDDDDDFGDFDVAPITHVEDSLQFTNVSAPVVVDGGAHDNFETAPELCTNKTEVDEFGAKQAVLDLQVPPNVDAENVINDEFGDFDSALVAGDDNAIQDIVVDDGFVPLDASEFALHPTKTEMVSAVEDDIDFGGFDTAPELLMQIPVQSTNTVNTVDSEAYGEINNPLEADVKDRNKALSLKGNAVVVDDVFGDCSGEQVTQKDNQLLQDVPSVDEIDFKEIDAAPVMTVQEVPFRSTDVLGTTSAEDDGLSDFDAAPLTSENNQHAILNTTDASDDFGEFDAAPEFTEQEVPLQSTDVHSTASTVDDGFGDFDAATPVATIIQQATQYITDNDNDFGDFGAAPELTEKNSVPVDSTDVGNAASAVDDGFGDFDVATPIAIVSQQGDDDDFGNFDAAPELIEQEVPVHSTDIPNVAIVKDDGFGDFDAATSVATKSQQTTQNTANDDDDFGDFDTAPFESVSDVHSNDKATENFGEFYTSPPKMDADDDDDDFGDFDAAPSEYVSDQVTDKNSEPSSSLLVLSQAFINDPIISNIRSAMPTFFTNDECSDAEEEEVVPVVETKEKSIEEILNIMDTSENEREDSKCYQSVIDVLYTTSAPVDEESVVVDNNNCKYFDRYGHVWYPVGRLRTNNDIHTKDTNENNTTLVKRAVFLPTSITDISTNVPVEPNSKKNNVTPSNLSPAPFVPTETIVSIPPKLPKVSKR